MKDAWYRLRSSEVGIENLHLKHVVAALETCGLTDRRWRTEDPPIGIDWAASIGKLWCLIDTLLGIKDRRDDASRSALQRCAIAPAWDGTIRPVGDLLQLEQNVQGLLDDIGVDAAFLDESQLGDDVPGLLAEVPVATVSQVVADAAAAFERGSDADGDTRAALLRWLFEHQKDLSGDDLARVTALPIFPTAGDPRPLDDLALPSNFQDPLALAFVLETESVKEMVPFFKRLGAKLLTIITYCTDYLAPAIENKELSDIKREKATRWLATHLSGIRDEQSIGIALRPLPLVPCTDGVWRPGSEVYLRDDLALLVGDDVAIAATPALGREPHVELFQWLGAVREPRPHDIVTQCRRLIRGPSDHRQIAEAIVRYVAGRFKADPEKTDRDFAALKQIPGSRWKATALAATCLAACMRGSGGRCSRARRSSSTSACRSNGVPLTSCSGWASVTNQPRTRWLPTFSTARRRVARLKATCGGFSTITRTTRRSTSSRASVASCLTMTSG